jgi:ABC-type multidrug transport system fused ATPase/permease subunit
MIESIVKFFKLFTKKEKRQFYLLTVAMLFLGLTEVAGIGSISPFLAVVSNPEAIHKNELLNRVYTMLEFKDAREFVIFLGSAVLVFIVLRNALAAMAKFLEIRFAEFRGFRLSRMLLSKYMGEPYVYFLNKNSAELSRNVLAEARNSTDHFLIPLLELMTKLVTVASVVVFLVLVNPVVALIVASALTLVYGIIYLSVKRVLFRLGKKRLLMNREQFKIVKEAFGGIKDVKLLGKEEIFLDIFGKVARKTARYHSNKKIIGSFPRFALDTIVFGVMIGMILYLLATQEGGFSSFISMLGLYGLAAYRLMPALDVVFKNIATIRGTQAVVDALYEDLKGYVEPEHPSVLDIPPAERIPFNHEIRLDGIVFRYPGSDADVIHGQSLIIPKNSTVGFAGPTGCGKTTLIDLILGLLRPTAGTISVDGTPITEENLRSWQANLGYVPQAIFLSDDSIARNIAFGVPAKLVDMEKVKKAAEIAHLKDFIEKELPQGYETLVGEQGVRLSGGQRQRIGIARALYHDPEVLVLDEATSALDGLTEAYVMEAIEDLAGKKTIILIAHRLSTLKDANTIFLLEKGRIIGRGGFAELVANNEKFKSMAENA